MELQSNYYQVLGIPVSATSQEVVGRYRQLARLFHPDVAIGDKTHAQQVFVQINIAYATLRDERRRKSYDAKLFGQAEPQPQFPANRTGATAPAADNGMSLFEAVAAAQAAYYNGNNAQAERISLQIIAADPQNGAAHRILGEISEYRCNHQQALKHFTAAVEGGDRSRILQEKIARLHMSVRN